ncbi:ABC transporter substrate-binding protein [Halobacteriales archaeon QS_1_68_20]|nr:MAG: ABC transporter substrate-binding protein [Halobacteriales archaeon QS_1_68_20]
MRLRYTCHVIKILDGRDASTESERQHGRAGTTSRGGRSRRAFLASAGTTAALGVAGCLGSGGDTVKVGFAVAQSGAYTLLGESVINGFKLRVEEELDGQLGGRDVEFVSQDTEGDPGTGSSIAQEFITREEVDVIVGSISGAVASAMRPVIEDHVDDLVWLCPVGIGWQWPMDTPTDDVSVSCTSTQFITGDAYYQPSAPMADFAIENLGDSCVLAFADYSAGYQYGGLFRNRFEELGGDIAGEVPVPVGTEDYKPYLQNVDTSADFVFGMFAGSDAINFVKQFHETGLHEELDLSGVGFLAEADALGAQGDAAVGTYSALPYTPGKDTERNQEFVEAYQDVNDREPNVYACTSYDAAQVADTAIEEVGGTDANDIADVIPGIEVDSPRGYFEMTDSMPYHPVQDVDIRRVVATEGDAPPTNEVIDTIERVKAPFDCA